MDSKSFAEKRHSVKNRRENAFVENVLDTLETALALEEEGKKEDSEELMNSLKNKLQGMLGEISTSNEFYKNTFSKEKLPSAGKILAENHMVVLSMIAPTEYDYYMDVSYECSSMKSFFKDDQFKADLWQGFLDEYTIVASIYDKETNAYVGYCSIKDMRKADWEISIEEKAEYRNKGYGYNALSLFISNLTRLTGNRFYRVRVDIDNIASQKLFKKLGGYPDGISEFLLHGEDLIAFQQENLHHAEDESIKSIAEEFCVDPEDILGHVLEYRIDRIKQLEEMSEEDNG